MKILVYGAGNIGGLYAGLLAKSGQDVSILARGGRLADIRAHGIQLENVQTGEQSTVPIDAVEQLDADDRYDLVLVILPKNKIAEVLPILGVSRGTPNVMFFGNNAAGPQSMIEALGRDRVLLGFPGAAAVPHEGRIHYLILSAREQPTTIGELDGRRSPRIEAIGKALRGAGFPVALCANMNAWLKTHAAEMVPTAGALYMAGAAHHLANAPDARRLMVRAIREGYRVLHARGIPITPAMHRVFEWLPERLLVGLVKRGLSGDTAAIKIGHAHAAGDEMKLLADEFRVLAEGTGVDMTAWERLYQNLAPAPELAVGVVSGEG